MSAAAARTRQAHKDNPHTGPLIGGAAGYDVIDCVSCGFRHVLPLPEDGSAAAAYETGYYSETKPDYLERAEADRDWAQAFYRDRIAELWHALGEAVQPGLRLLDIGSGPGHFLDEAAAQGWQAEGIEPSRQAAAFCRARGLTIHNRAFSQSFQPGGTAFSAIHCMNVLEHVPDPAGLMTHAWSLLKPGGVVCVGVPNDYSPFQLAARQAGSGAWWLAPPHHLNYFCFESLERMLARTGFEPVARLTSFPMEMFVLMGRSYPGNDALGRSLHGERKLFDQALEASDPAVRRGFYKALAGQGFGREAIVIARKAERHV